MASKSKYEPYRVSPIRRRDGYGSLARRVGTTHFIPVRRGVEPSRVTPVCQNCVGTNHPRQVRDGAGGVEAQDGGVGGVDYKLSRARAKNDGSEYPFAALTVCLLILVCLSLILVYLASS